MGTTLKYGFVKSIGHFMEFSYFLIKYENSTKTICALFMAVLHGTRIWMTDGGEFLEDEEAAEFHLLKLVTAAKGRSD